MNNSFIFVGCLIIMIFFHADSIFAEGWGFKKSTNNNIPDIGSYENILKNNLVFYADKHTKKDIYLTFDNGYEAGYTKDILKVLRSEERRVGSDTKYVMSLAALVKNHIETHLQYQTER